MMEEVLEQYQGDEEAQSIALYARQRAADALNASQGQAADGSEGAPSEATGELPQQRAEGEGGEGPASEAGMAEEEPEVQGGRQPFLVKRGAEGAEGESRQKQQREGTSTPLPFKRVAVDDPTTEAVGTTKALRLADAKEPVEKSARTTSSTPTLPLLPSPTSSSSPTRLAASPTFAGSLGNVSRVQLGEEEVEVDEEYILDPAEWGEVENLDLSEWDRSEDDGPPNLTDEELYKLDFEAEEIEVTRLLEMGVLIAVDKDNVIDETYRKLTTKHVKDWRFRDGQWLRRSRLVARDYKFLEPELEGLFSPASNTLSTKLWAAVVQSSDGELNLYSADIKDAYLMVEQDEKVYVTNAGVHYILGRCLPGQRVGSKSWYDLLAKVNKDFGLLTYKANPSVFYKPIVDKFEKPLVVSTHVDDLQVMGTEEDVNNLFQHFKNQGWKLQVEGPCGPRAQGQCSFLKRKFVTDGDGNMWIKLNDKYIHKLVEELNLANHKSKAVPTTSGFRKGYEYQSLSPEKARGFRTCVGILLYMASERPDIQCATRALASKVTNPDEGDWRELKQVVLYLKDTAGYAQRMGLKSSMSSSMREIAHQDFKEEIATSACSGPSLLEVFTDADWAGDRSTRRSCSCAVFYLNGNYFFAVTRTQRSIALSSAESEFVAAVSAAADAVYVKRLLEKVLNATVFVEMRLDNAAARALLQRQGVQRTRHIATGLLWVQDMVAQKIFAVKPVPGQANPADLGTKGHGQKRRKYLLGLLSFQDQVGGEDVGLQRVQRVQGVRRDLRAALFAALGSLATGCTTEELHIRSVREEREPEEQEEPEPEEHPTSSSESDAEALLDAERQDWERLLPQVPPLDLGNGGAVRLPRPVPPDPFEAMDQDEVRAFRLAEDRLIFGMSSESEAFSPTPSQLVEPSAETPEVPQSVGEEISPKQYMVNASRKLLTLLKSEQRNPTTSESEDRMLGYVRRLEVLRFAWMEFDEGRSSPRAVRDFVDNTVTFGLGEVELGEVTHEEARAEVAYQGQWQYQDSALDSTRSRSARGSSSRDQA